MPLVVDAKAAVALAVELPYSPMAANWFGVWLREPAELYVPLLWEYEVASALHRMTALGLLSAVSAEGALDRLLDLPIERVPPERQTHRAAMQWADRLGHSVAYDAQYMALAERLGAERLGVEFWTADRLLANRAWQLDVSWVRWIGGEAP